MSNKLKVVCVRVGTKYGIRYVHHLSRMLERHIPIDYELICLTDDMSHVGRVKNTTFIDISKFKHFGWFAKMLVFNREVVGPGKILYIDLDMVIVDDLGDLVGLDTDFAICQNFTQIRQMNSGEKVTWPCKYGSCVMLLGKEWNSQPVWDRFDLSSWDFIDRAKQFGDQWIIEQIWPDAEYLQDLLPHGYFLHYRDFDGERDRDAAILVFAGKTKPIDCEIPWIQRAWYCEKK